MLNPPTTEQIQRTLKLVRYQKVIVNADHSTVRYQSEDVEIEFGAMGKGYAIDGVARILTNYEISRALVNFGSSTYALGSPSIQNGWRVAIRHPRNRERVIDIVVLKDCAIGTSGDYEQGLWLDGQWCSHILDPRTGYPVTGTVCTSVVARAALEADAFSTAAFVMGPESRMQFLKNQIDIEGIIVGGGKKETLEIIQTADWLSFCPKTKPKALLARRQFLTALLAAMGLLMIDPWIGYATVYLTPEEALKRLMPQDSKLREETIKLTSVQKEQIEKLLRSHIREDVYTVWIGNKDEKRVGYAVTLDVIGKERPITFMVAFEPRGKGIGDRSPGLSRITRIRNPVQAVRTAAGLSTRQCG